MMHHQAILCRYLKEVSKIPVSEHLKEGVMYVSVFADIAQVIVHVLGFEVYRQRHGSVIPLPHVRSRVRDIDIVRLCRFFCRQVCFFVVWGDPPK